VVVLAALLVYRLAFDRTANGLSATRLSGRPEAPSFALSPFWRRADSWPPALRALARSGRISPSDFRGHPLVVNFWASWCGPCTSETPRLVAAANARRGKVVFLGIDVHDSTADARKFLARRRASYASLHGDDSVLQAYGLIGLPETYYLDARGRVVGRTAGEVSARQLARGIAAAAGS
jgi:cytochrome c biogenesis protein CcmG/thiol:disulfide interchange protein DsbE